MLRFKLQTLLRVIPVLFLSLSLHPQFRFVNAQLPTGTETSTPLNTAIVQAGKKYLGDMSDFPELNDEQYLGTLKTPGLFGQMTPGNSMKWDATEPTRGQFTFSNGDAIVAIADSAGQIMRGHTCVWHNQLPSWVSSGGFSAEELTEIVEEHVKGVVGHWAGKMRNLLTQTPISDSWDVVNEAFNDDGTMRESVFYTTIGEGYIATAFNTARAADPNAKLYINDYNIEGTSAKSTAMINLVKSLKSQGVPIDGIGLQGHFILGQIPNTLVQNMQAMTALGVEVAFTEVDIRVELPETEETREQQKADFNKVVEACMQVEGCVGVTLGGFTDKYSWVPGTFPGFGAALIYDEEYVAKPAYDGIVDAIKGKSD
ncbi:endo-beta-1,4-glucanase [Dendrothele bispora CBS 962.96]|uniref:Beta-xylanase n=1 Tax=Dendrothele bispora (strain CBS 962.96) TaxID=1314807 RepID=A0A4S8LN58_DENBC|nr:endo-beta-1,4-glucanase [Dendrothele bispora CBS 962.96]